MPDGDSFYVVALRTIQPGEEVVHSYLREAMLFEPRDLRQKRLRSWFPSCWCERCSSEYDDVRCFPCAKGGGGVCMVKPSPEGDTLEHPNSVVLLRAEGQIRKKYIALEEGQEQITPPAVQILLQLAQRMLGVGHWLLASIADLAQDMATQMGLLQASELPKQERLKSLNTAAQLAKSGWRAGGRLAVCRPQLNRSRRVTNEQAICSPPSANSRRMPSWLRSSSIYWRGRRWRRWRRWMGIRL